MNNRVISEIQASRKCLAIKGNGEICGNRSSGIINSCLIKNHIEQVRPLPESVITERLRNLAVLLEQRERQARDLVAANQSNLLRVVEEEKRVEMPRPQAPREMPRHQAPYLYVDFEDDDDDVARMISQLSPSIESQVHEAYMLRQENRRREFEIRDLREYNRQQIERHVQARQEFFERDPEASMIRREAPVLKRDPYEKIKFSVLQNQNSCPICMTDYEKNTDILISNCGHILCGICFDKLQKKICPLCRCDIRLKK